MISKQQYEGIVSGKPPKNVFSEDQINILSKKGFIRNVYEFDLNECIKKNNQSDPDIFAMYLILTEQCNMDCQYCSQSSFRTRKRMGDMSCETVKDVLGKFYATDTKRRRTVVLYGGEPTINRGGLECAVKFIRDIKKDWESEIVIFTNGILLDNEYIEFLKQNKVDVILSIDGPRDINDKYRIYSNGGSYDFIKAAIEKCQRLNFPFGVSTTIAAHNSGHLGDVVTFFYEKFNPFSIGLNPLHYVPHGREHLSVGLEETAEAMIEAYVVASTYGIYVEQVMRRVRPFILSTPRLKDCPACGGMIRVLPDGSFGPCGHFMEEKKECEKREYSYETSNIVKKWNSRVSLSVPKCRGCSAIALCGGGCPYNSLKNGGDIFSPNDERSCIQAKLILRWLLEKVAESFNGDEFREITIDDKKKLLGKIDLNKHVPMSEYSRYGEFKVDERFL